jgi:hypothetical protein
MWGSPGRCRGRGARSPPRWSPSFPTPAGGWDAVVIGEYERAFYGSQYAAITPLFEHYGVQLWTPETGGQVDYAKRSRIVATSPMSSAAAAAAVSGSRYLCCRPASTV